MTLFKKLMIDVARCSLSLNCKVMVVCVMMIANWYLYDNNYSLSEVSYNASARD